MFLGYFERFLLGRNMDSIFVGCVDSWRNLKLFYLSRNKLEQYSVLFIQSGWEMVESPVDDDV